MRLDSTLSRERRDSQRIESRSQSNSVDLDDNIREKYLISNVALESNISSSKISIERESKFLFVRLEAKVASLYQYT